MLIAHGPIAVISSFLFQKKEITKLTKVKKFLLFTFAFFLGILPDFDIFYLIATNRSPFDHHSLATHTPFFWIITTLMLFLVLSKVFEKKYYYALLISKVYLISTLSHVLVDTFSGFVKIFYPFSNQYFTIFGTSVPSNIFAGYLGDPAFGLEIVVIAIFIFLMLKIFLPKVEKIGIPLIVISICYLIFNIYFYTQSYQVNTYKLENGGPVFDQDKDGISDSRDYDIDNDFKDNFNEVSKEDRLLKVNEIFEKNPTLLPKNKRFLEKVLYFYGGLNIERLILQAYHELGYPLNPIVWNFANLNNSTKRMDNLYQYLLSDEKFGEVLVDDGEALSKRGEIKAGSLIIIQKGSEYCLGIYISRDEIIYEDENGRPTVKSWFDFINIDREMYDIFIEY